MKKITLLSIVTIVLLLFSTVSFSQTINVSAQGLNNGLIRSGNGNLHYKCALPLFYQTSTTY
jgi:hypothetical protein